jgi:hypothetical protein
MMGGVGSAGAPHKKEKCLTKSFTGPALKELPAPMKRNPYQFQ